MSKRAEGPSKPEAGSENPKRWTTQTLRRSRAPLRLLGALRGVGVLIWSGGEGEVDYELDVFGAGDVFSANGSLEGEAVARLATGEAVEVSSFAAQLKLSDGREISLNILRLDPPQAQIEVGAADAAELLPPRET